MFKKWLLFILWRKAGERKMKCRNCGKDNCAVCLCGFCLECNEKYSHTELNNKLKERKEKERRKKNE
jgi:hypothetical protein